MGASISTTTPTNITKSTSISTKSCGTNTCTSTNITLFSCDDLEKKN